MLNPISRAKDFPSLEGKVYLNTAAEGIPPRSVEQALLQYFSDKAQGMDGRDAHFQVEAQARRKAAQLYGLQPEEIAFCSSSAEAANLLYTAVHLGEKGEAVINDLDFPSGATPWIDSGGRTRLWHSRDGQLLLEDLELLVNENTQIVQTSLVSFYNGHRLTWDPFVELVRRYAPNALIVVDVTQAVGRIELNLSGADMIFASTHKWLLGSHGGCVVGIPNQSAQRIVTRAGGWYHLQDAFGPDRFKKIQRRAGAASFATGMPAFPALYALNAGMEYLLETGIAAIAAHADPLVARLAQALEETGFKLMCPYNSDCPTGIIAFQHPQCDILHKALQDQDIHVMNHAGRIRLSVHGYVSESDIERAINVFQSLVYQM